MNLHIEKYRNSFREKEWKVIEYHIKNAKVLNKKRNIQEAFDFLDSLVFSDYNIYIEDDIPLNKKRKLIFNLFNFTIEDEDIRIKIFYCFDFISNFPLTCYKNMYTVYFKCFLVKHYVIYMNTNNIVFIFDTKQNISYKFNIKNYIIDVKFLSLVSSYIFMFKEKSFIIKNIDSFFISNFIKFCDSEIMFDSLDDCCLIHYDHSDLVRFNDMQTIMFYIYNKVLYACETIFPFRICASFDKYYKYIDNIQYSYDNGITLITYSI